MRDESLGMRNHVGMRDESLGMSEGEEPCRDEGRVTGDERRRGTM